jgi:hypothetical protein
VVARSVVLKTPESLAGMEFNGDVQCKSGELVVGGGYKLPPGIFHPDNTHAIPSMSVIISAPSFDGASPPPDGSTPTGWHFELLRNFDYNSEEVTLYVLCAAAT